jgi:hypothetical protein
MFKKRIYLAIDSDTYLLLRSRKGKLGVFGMLWVLFKRLSQIKREGFKRDS